MKTVIYFILFLMLSGTVIYSGDWLTVGGNQQRNGISNETGPSAALEKWNKNSLSSYWGMQIFTYGNYCATSRYTSLSPLRAPLICFDINSGDTLWSMNAAANGVMVVMGFNNNKIYARNFQQQGFDSIYAINPVNGSVIWKSNFTVERGIIWTAVFASNGDLILPGSGTKRIMRVNQSNGDTVWTNNRIIPNTGAECMCIFGTTLYTFEGGLTTPKRMMAIDINTGATKYFSDPLPGDGDQEVPFSIGPNGTIYVIRDGGSLHALKDNGSGFTQLWLNPGYGTGMGTYMQMACGSDSTLYAPFGRKIYHINQQTGSVIDSTAELSTSGTISPRFAIGADGKVYIGNGASVPSDGKYFAFSSTLQPLWNVAMPYNYYSGPALGQNGILLVTGSGTNIIAYQTPTGIISTGGEIPAVFRMYQNYPDPFNPTAKIKFDIPAGNGHGRFVHLSVFDITGREIAVLVNDQLKAGRYEVEFDGSGHSSGVYFYRIKTEGFSETKKMILIK